MPKVRVRTMNGLVVMTFDYGYTTIKIAVWNDQANKIAELLLAAVRQEGGTK